MTSLAYHSDTGTCKSDAVKSPNNVTLGVLYFAHYLLWRQKMLVYWPCPSYGDALCSECPLLEIPLRAGTRAHAVLVVCINWSQRLHP